MPRLFRIAAAVAAVAAMLAPLPGAGEKKNLRYEQVFAGGAPRGTAGREARLLAPLPEIEGWRDDTHYLEMRLDPADRKRKLFVCSAVDGSSAPAHDYAAIQKDLPAGVDLHSAIATSTTSAGFVFERESDLYHYDARARRYRRLTATPGRERNPRFSPDGRRLAYTRDNNLFIYDLDDAVERQITADGSETVSNGWASWVYYEEILGRSSRYAAFWWAPDSKRIAYMRFDDAPVPVFPIYHERGQHGELERQRYPKAGDPNPHVAIGVATVADAKTVWMDFEARADHYIAWPFWAADGSLTVQWMNRGQDTIRLYRCDPSSGRKSMILEQRQPSWVVFFEELHHFQDGSGFLLRSDADGWDHLYYYASEGKLRRRLTTGEWQVRSIVRVDEAGRTVYFMGRRGKSWDEALMKVSLDGGETVVLTPEPGVHRVHVSPRGSYFIDTVSTAASPEAMSLRRGDGVEVRKLGDSRSAAIDDYAWGKAELFTIPSGDGYDLPARWVLPVDFSPERVYPVIFTVYGGPDAGAVRNSWPGLEPHYWAERGVITISVDHRGSGHFGKKGVAAMHRSLGKWEIADLIAAAKWLRAKSFVARDRIGIAGSSYGGYTTMMALTYGAEHFNYGQARSSVTDWRLYDTVYTERYMDTPAENPEGYRNGSVLTWLDRYRGGLRIVHGTIDDNVHMQNSLQVVEWLTSHNKPFELMVYPGSRHGLQAAQQAHAAREAHDFWVRNLLSGKLPESATLAGR